MAETMTMVTIENGEPEVQEVLVNPFLTIQGSGPLFTQYLYDRKVSVVIIKDAEPRACEITGSPTYS